MCVTPDILTHWGMGVVPALVNAGNGVTVSSRILVAGGGAKHGEERRIRRFMNAFTALLFGCGILAFVIGLFYDGLKWQHGLIIGVAFWVIAFALRVFLVSRSED